MKLESVANSLDETILRGTASSGLSVIVNPRPGFVRTRDQIVGSVHGSSAVLSSRAVDVHMTALRRKLGDLGGLIETVRGVGYRLRDSDAEST